MTKFDMSLNFRQSFLGKKSIQFILLDFMQPNTYKYLCNFKRRLKSTLSSLQNMREIYYKEELMIGWVEGIILMANN